MKNPLSAQTLTKALRASAFAMIATGLGLAYSVATSSSSLAQDGAPQTCTVCHKGRQNLELPCHSMAVQRHMGHGDTAGPCPTSRAFGGEERKTPKAAKAAPAPAAVAKASR